jgi:hypothetical protein
LSGDVPTGLWVIGPGTVTPVSNGLYQTGHITNTSNHRCVRKSTMSHHWRTTHREHFCEPCNTPLLPGQTKDEHAAVCKPLLVSAHAYAYCVCTVQPKRLLLMEKARSRTRKQATYPTDDIGRHLCPHGCEITFSTKGAAYAHVNRLHAHGV